MNIEKWTERWGKYDDLRQQIVDILKGDKQAESGQEAVLRMWAVNNLLRDLEDEEFEVFQETRGERVLCWGDVLVPILDLRGIWMYDFDLKGVQLPKSLLQGASIKCSCLEEANFEQAHLELATLRGSDMKRANFNEAWLEHADLSASKLNGVNFQSARLSNSRLNNANIEGGELSWAHLEGADLSQTNLSRANLTRAYLQGTKFYESRLEGANFNDSRTGSWFDENSSPLLVRLKNKDHFIAKLINAEDDSLDDFEFSCIKREVKGIFANLNIGNSTYFNKVEILPSFWSVLLSGQFGKIWRLMTNRWFYTSFIGMRIEEADTTLAADLRRYVEDQRFVARLRDKSSLAYNFWNLTTACGWSSIRVVFIGLFLILFFGFLYANAPFPTPNWIVNILDNPITRWLIVEPGGALIAIPESYDNIPRFWYWNYVSFDIFTNLGIRVTTKPVSVAGIIFMFLETVMGWVTLGLMLSVFANKYARRS